MSKKFVLFMFIGLILASPGWYLVTLQLHYVSNEESLFYRFILAALFVEFLRRFTNEEKPEKLNGHGWKLLMIQGISLFGINYWLCYEASHHMISGLIPALPAVIFVPAMIIERLTSPNKIPLTKITGSFLACLGIFLLFYKEIMTVEVSHLFGLFLVFVSTFFTLGGTHVSKKLLQENKLPILWVTSRALFFGGIFFLFTVLLGKGFTEFPASTEFVYSLIYVSIFVSGLLFWIFIYMVKNFGTSTASFLWVLVPAMTLSVSAIYEGYEWSLTTVGGLLCIIIGGFLNYGNFAKLYKSLKASSI